MKKKVVIVGLIVLSLFLVFAIFFAIYLDKYRKIGLNINEKIHIKEEEIKLNNDKLNDLQNENMIKYKNIENMNDYIESLNKRVKEYE